MTEFSHLTDHLMNHLTVRENGLDSHRGGGMVHHGTADILDGHSLLGHGGDLLAENNMMLGHMGDQVGLGTRGTRYRAGRRMAAWPPANRERELLKLDAGHSLTCHSPNCRGMLEVEVAESGGFSMFADK